MRLRERILRYFDRKKESFQRYVNKYSLEIMCAAMYTSGNVNLDLLDGMRR